MCTLESYCAHQIFCAFTSQEISKISLCSQLLYKILISLDVMFVVVKNAQQSLKLLNKKFKILFVKKTIEF